VGGVLRNSEQETCLPFMPRFSQLTIHHDLWFMPSSDYM
jgi:hypothetical protein